MSSLNYMSLRNFDFFSFFLEILCFFVPHYTRQILQKIDAKRNDHVFPKLNEPSWFLQIFVLENNIFHIFYFLFPDWYIHETIHNLIFKIFIFVSRLIHPRNEFACNEELRHRGVIDKGWNIIPLLF